MSDWSSGYVVDLDYTYGFYRELAPSLLGLLSLLHGFRGPGLDIAPLTYCELGCGQGLSANLLAAANPHVQFYATDFNPAHIAGADGLRRAAHLDNIAFFDDSFAEFLARDDLPDFDIVALHGIYSWISPENRRTITEFIRRKLKPGGLVYISYNAMPGWAAFMPLRRLLVDHAAGGAQSRTSRIGAALDFAERLAKLEARYFAGNPKIAARIADLRKKSPNYLAHEYFNRDWHPLYFADVAQELGEAKLQWVGVASVLDTMDELHLTADQRAMLADIDDVTLRQTVRDHMIDQQFRRDVFIKGPVPVARPQARERWLDMRFALLRPATAVPSDIQGIRFKVQLDEELRAAIVASLAERPRSIREIMENRDVAKHGPDIVTQALRYLVGQGSCSPCLPEEGLAERNRRAALFNAAIVESTRQDHRLTYFASGVTGSGHRIESLDQLIWLGWERGEPDIPAFVWECLSRSGHRLNIGERRLTTAQEHIAEIGRRLTEFDEKTAPLLHSLGIALPSAPIPERRVNA